MDNFIFSVNVVMPLFILMAAGYAARRFNIVSDKFLSEFSQFVFKFLIPLMLFQNVRYVFHGDFSNTSLIFAAIAGVSIVIIVSLCIVPLFIKRSCQRGSMIQAIYRSNFLIYGLPLATGMYGQEAAHSISMMLGVIVPFYNVTAVIILSVFSETRTSRLSLKNLLAGVAGNPLILGCAAGVLFGALRVQIPSVLNRPIDELSIAASPLALFLMGGDFKFKSLNNNLWKVLSATAARLVIVPLAAMLVFIPMGFRNIDLAVLLCLFCTPTAVSSYIMAANMGCDGELSGQIVVVTTAVSCLSIFLFIFALKNLCFL